MLIVVYYEIMIQVYKQAFKARTTSLRARREAGCFYPRSASKALIHVCNSLFFMFHNLENKAWNMYFDSFYKVDVLCDISLTWRWVSICCYVAMFFQIFVQNGWIWRRDIIGISICCHCCYLATFKARRVLILRLRTL